MPQEVKLGHHVYHVVTVEDLKSGKMRGKNVVFEGIIEDKPVVEFLPMELPSYRTTFSVDGIRVEFSGSPCIKRGDRIRVYGRFLAGDLIATAIETDEAIYMAEE
ncbi:GTP-binding protein [Thermococcus waiotapuensis]|uniref:GTP-binding protein n=1 Tax=Thermococcus waiotapuensis TaxID=90909 RepID=A0AAE4NUI4_9EURY|nr:GTP-binding protein [Thermococcus waiotapuensis]MDV3103572.1 GTP-binding protein [Thermococcus waiotapuensis]